MALFETLSAMLTGKAAAAAATLTIVSGTAAGATGALPQGLQTAFDNVTGVAQEDDESVEELDSLEADTLTDDTTVTDDTAGDTDDGATEDEVVDTDETEEADEVEEVEETDERSEQAEQVLSELGDGCMPEDEDCDFGQAVAGNARENGAENSAAGKATAEENKTRRGAPDETDTPDETDSTDEADTTEETTAPEETEDTEDAPDAATQANEVEAAGEDSSDGPGVSNKPDHTGR